MHTQAYNHEENWADRMQDDLEVHTLAFKFSSLGSDPNPAIKTVIPVFHRQGDSSMCATPQMDVKRESRLLAFVGGRERSCGVLHKEWRAIVGTLAKFLS